MTKLALLFALAFVPGCLTDGSMADHGEPGLPRALGTIGIDDSVDASAWTRLELRFAPADGEAWASYEQSYTLADNPMPIAYAIGGDLGVNQSTVWRLEAWLTNEIGADHPTSGEPAASRTLAFECTDGCPSQSGIELVIE